MQIFCFPVFELYYTILFFLYLFFYFKKIAASIHLAVLYCSDVSFVGKKRKERQIMSQAVTLAWYYVEKVQLPLLIYPQSTTIFALWQLTVDILNYTTSIDDYCSLRGSLS